MNKKTYYTNLYSETPEKISIISYDNNKNVKIIREDGAEDEIRTGWVYKNIKMTKFLSRRELYILGGGDKKKYKGRANNSIFPVRCKYEVFVSGTNNGTLKVFTTLQQAIKYGVNYANSNHVECSIYQSRNKIKSWSGGTIAFCMPNGFAEYYCNHKNRKRNKVKKWIRGYGKGYKMYARQWKAQNK